MELHGTVRKYKCPHYHFFNLSELAADPFSIHSLSALDILLVEVHYKTRFHYEIVKELAIAEMSPL